MPSLEFRDFTSSIQGPQNVLGSTPACAASWILLAVLQCSEPATIFEGESHVPGLSFLSQEKRDSRVFCKSAEVRPSGCCSLGMGLAGGGGGNCKCREDAGQPDGGCPRWSGTCVPACVRLCVTCGHSCATCGHLCARTPVGEELVWTPADSQGPLCPCLSCPESLFGSCAFS